MMNLANEEIDIMKELNHKIPSLQETVKRVQRDVTSKETGTIFK